MKAGANDRLKSVRGFTILPGETWWTSFDNRGAGRTDKPDALYSIEMMAEDTVGLIQTLDIGQAHLLGISMGGRIALALALRYAEQVKKLVLGVHVR